MKKSLFFFILCLLGLVNKTNGQWTESTGPKYGYVECIAVSGGDIFAGTWNGGLFFSTDNGTSWTRTSLNQGSPVMTLAVDDSGKIFAGTWSGEVFASANGGVNWSLTSLASPSPVMALVANGGSIFAGTYNDGIFISTNSGASWNQVNTGLTRTSVLSLVTSSGNLFAGTNGSGVFLSTNNGTSWAQTNLNCAAPIMALAVSNGNLFAGTNGSGVFLSTNNGGYWTTINNGLTNNEVWSIAITGNNIFAGTNGSGVFLSTNNGTNWVAVNTGLTDSYLDALCVDGNNLFAGTYDSDALWERPLSQMVTGVKGKNQIPLTFDLKQNYPNPFNPSTIITYSISTASKVTLDVYDILGQKMAALINEQEVAGNHTAVFDGSRLASGIYFYRLQAGSFTRTLKMILVK